MESISPDPFNQDVTICFDLICFARGSLADVMKAEARRVLMHWSMPSLLGISCRHKKEAGLACYMLGDGCLSLRLTLTLSQIPICEDSPV